jgi:carboxylesterase
VPIAPEDEPFFAPASPAADEGKRVGVLLCHGFTGTPQAIRPWAEHLSQQGFAVSVPLFPGHATSWQDCNRTTYRDWYAEAERAFEKLQSECDHVFVGGLSLGGFIALNLAVAKGRDVAGLLLVNPAINTERADAKLMPVLRHVVPMWPAIGNDIKKPGVLEHAYSKTPIKALATLFDAWKAMRPRLPEVTQPMLVFRSRVDHVVDATSGQIIMAGVSSRDLEEQILDNSYHVATLDYDAPVIFERSAEFIEQRTRP